MIDGFAIVTRVTSRRTDYRRGRLPAARSAARDIRSRRTVTGSTSDTNDADGPLATQLVTPEGVTIHGDAETLEDLFLNPRRIRLEAAQATPSPHTITQEDIPRCTTTRLAAKPARRRAERARNRRRRGAEHEAERHDFRDKTRRRSESPRTLDSHRDRRNIGCVADDRIDPAEAAFDDHDRLGELVGVVDVGDECRGVPVVAEHERKNRGVLTADDGQRDVATEQVVRVVDGCGVLEDDERDRRGVLACSHLSMVNPQVMRGFTNYCELTGSRGSPSAGPTRSPSQLLVQDAGDDPAASEKSAVQVGLRSDRGVES